jgi:chromosome segregation ATPase
VNIEITDKELYELLGRKDVEIFTNEKVIETYRVAVERVKGLAAETDALKAAKTSLETSNGQLASKNIQLDQALTEARKERETAKGELANSMTSLVKKNQEIEAAKAETLHLAGTAHDLQGFLDESRTTVATLQARITIPKGKPKR